jgi:prepilin-type N-terminal cleavage/methylation domain-containing protein
MKTARGFTLIEMLTAMAIASLILTALAITLTSSLSFVRNSEGNLTASMTARSVFMLLDRDLSGMFAYPGNAAVDRLAGPDAGRSCYFRIGALGGGRWVTAMPNAGAADHARVTYRIAVGNDTSRTWALYRDVYGWNKSWTDPALARGEEAQLVAQRVKNIEFQPLNADGITPWTNADALGDKSRAGAGQGNANGLHEHGLDC